MSSLVRRLVLADQPQETRFFAFLGGFGAVLAAVYWVASYEVAGSVLLAAFGLACLLAAAKLVAARPRRVARAARHDDGALVREGPGGGTGDVDRPFLDESGRLPGDTLAPFALGLGVALALTAVVFGPWLLVAGVVPLGWGAWAWLTGARDELDATVTGGPGDAGTR